MTAPVCKFCDQPAICLRLCKQHYRERMEPRFWAQVDKTPDGCWLWNGTLNKGYGIFSYGGFDRREQRAHRVCYIWTLGDIPEGMVLDHRCETKNCVNPDHLEPVLPNENIRRAWAGQPDTDSKRPGKRPYGSGSIKQVGPNTWRLRWRSGYDPLTDRYVAKQETFQGNSRAAQKRLALLVSQTGTPSAHSSVGALRNRWQSSAAVTAETMDRYGYALRHVPEGFWAMRLADVKPSVIASVYRSMQDAGGSPQSIRKAYTALSSMFAFAVRDDLIQSNPCRNVHPPEVERREYVIPTVDQLHRMIEWADTQPGSFGIWMRVMIGTGLRKGEALALQWKDVDLASGVLHVRNSMRRNRQRATTKTHASLRDVTLDDDTAEALRVWWRRCQERALAVGVRVPADGYVMSEDPECRTTITLTSATQRQRRLSARVGCPGARVHDLRHTHATMLLEAGVSPRTVADRLGHSRVSTTLDIYGHVLPGADRAAADVFRQALKAR